MKGTVEFKEVSKRYRLGTLGSLRDTFSAWLSRGNDLDNWRRTVWALRDVTFQVAPGESLGLIGPNGSGKTTTLKLLSNITRPSTGQILVQGRVASLIELGAGFHPELSGRENIYLNGAILGLKRCEIRNKLEDIITFSGLERFIDTPVKRYSSGMYVRLGFAVAAHVEADVLLIDEVLAVGDSEFRRKCIERMEELRKSGTTLIFVSHNMYQVRRLCKQALLLVHGESCFLGNTDEAILTYEELIQDSKQDIYLERLGMAETPGAIIISCIELLDEKDQPVRRLRYDQTLKIRLAYRTQQPIVDPIFRMRLIGTDGATFAMAASTFQPGLTWTLAGSGLVTARMEPVQLVSGRYTVDVQIVDSTDSMLLTSGHSDWFYVNDPAFGHETQRGAFVPNVVWLHEPGVTKTDLQTEGIC